MKYSLIAGAALAAVANAHTDIWNIWVDGVDQGVGNAADGSGYIRGPARDAAYTNPVKDITSKDMTCNVGGTAVKSTIDVAAGSKVTLEWHHNDNTASDDIIAASHIGPHMVYLAPTASNGEGDVWVKIDESGYDAATKTWAVTTLIANKGKYEFTLPSTLADGEYLVRGEIIALHESEVSYADNSARGAQFYMECVQINVTGGGSTALPAGVAIPGAYAYTDPGVTFNSYGTYTEYTIPGPAVVDIDSGSTGTTPVASSSAAAPEASSAAPVASSAAPVASSPATTEAAVSSAAPVATEVASSLEPVTSAASVSVPAETAAPVASSTKSACKSKSASVVAPIATAAPAVSATKSACKSKTAIASAPVSSKSACKSKSIAAVSSAVPTTLATSAAPVATGSATVQKYGQCGGTQYSGSTTCAEGSTCNAYNEYYSQCI